MADGQHYDFPTYLLDAYEAITSQLAAYDETGDDRQLIRALRSGCIHLQQLVADTTFWTLLADHKASSEALPKPGDLADLLGPLIEAERYLLTQVGMSPRAVAVLLNEVELAARTGGGSDDMPTAELQSAMGALAEVTCAEWNRNKSLLRPMWPPTPDTPPPSGDLQNSRRVRTYVVRTAKVLGGGVVVVLNVIMGAHGLPAPLAGYSVQVGGGIIWDGVRGEGR